MIELYGVEHGFQSKEIQEKCINNRMSNPFIMKEFIFPSGRITYTLGYENIMLNILINEKNIDEDDILTNHKCPKIKWIDDNNIMHTHIPDIYIKSENKIIEVKSKYTSREECMPMILLKKKYAEIEGYTYKIYIINGKTKNIEYEIS